VLSFIAAKCSNIEDMNDILQETYMELYKTLSEKGPDYIENGEAFVINIAKAKIYQHYNIFQRARANLSLSEADDSDEKDILENADEMDLEDSVCTDALVEEIEAYIAKKNQTIRKIFFLRFSLDMKISEIAQLMSLSQNQVKNKLYRTINEIRAFYQEKGGLQ
jgi:RNA polymerase sigma-70 factor (ECF subfamily)